MHLLRSSQTPHERNQEHGGSNEANNKRERNAEATAAERQPPPV